MILQRQIQTSKTTILVIGGLPEDAINVKVVNKVGGLVIEWQKLFRNGLSNFEHDTWNNDLSGKWQPLGFLKDIQDDVAKELVDNASIEDILIYWNYMDGCWFDESMTALDSLNSLIQANCKLKNKYERLPNPDEFELLSEKKEAFKEWKEEQSKIFVNPFLLKKI